MSQQLITALRDCVSVMERDLNGLAVIQPELKAAREALATLDTAPVWHGEGLPPVGAVCEFTSDMQDGSDWHPSLKSGAKVEVIAHFHTGAADVAAFVFDHPTGRQVEQATADCFRPIRTPDQIAAEEQADTVRAACAELDDELSAFNQNIDCSMAIKVAIEAMIKAGYRKVEGGAA